MKDNSQQKRTIWRRLELQLKNIRNSKNKRTIVPKEEMEKMKDRMIKEKALKKQTEYIEFPYLEELKSDWIWLKIEENWAVCDLGKRDLIYMKNKDGKILRYSNKEHLLITGSHLTTRSSIHNIVRSLLLLVSVLFIAIDRFGSADQVIDDGSVYRSVRFKATWLFDLMFPMHWSVDMCVSFSEVMAVVVVIAVVLYVV